MSNKIHLPRLAIVITTRCNLSCKYCAMGVPDQKEAYHIDWEEFEKGLGSIFSVVDRTDSLEFAGGEPFLHTDLPRMIESYMQYKDRFKQWLIVTNGTISPSRELLETFRKHKDNGVLHLSDYNIHPGKTADLLAALDEIGFRYRVDKYFGDDQYQGGWVDPGEMAPRNRNENQLREVFRGCGLIQSGGCWRLYRGKLHICTRSLRCGDAGYVFPGDTVDLFDGTLSAEQKAEKLRAVVDAPYIAACDYCNGDLGTKDPSKRIGAGEQA